MSLFLLALSLTHSLGFVRRRVLFGSRTAHLDWAKLVPWTNERNRDSPLAQLGPGLKLIRFQVTKSFSIRRAGEGAGFFIRPTHLGGSHDAPTPTPHSEIWGVYLDEVKRRIKTFDLKDFFCLLPILQSSLWTQSFSEKKLADKRL